MTTSLVPTRALRSMFCKFAMLALVLILPACKSGNGSLTVTWTIASRSDASLCSQYGATSVTIRVANSSGNDFSRVTPSCSALTTTISDIPAGTYLVWAQMLDASGDTVSGADGPLAIAVTGGSTATQNFDFQATAFNDSGVGSLTVNWTIESSSSASECTTFNAANMSIQLNDSSGNAIGTAHTTPCTAFTWTMANLAPGTYNVTSTLLDANGQAVSTSNGPNSVTITANNTTTEPMDFPASAFTVSSATGDASS